MTTLGHTDQLMRTTEIHDSIVDSSTAFDTSTKQGLKYISKYTKYFLANHFKIFFLVSLVAFTATSLIGQTKVASYSFGKPRTMEYERLEFWTKDGNRKGISYVYGKDHKESKLQFLGKDILNGDTCFKVQFPNNYILYIVPVGLRLKVTDINGKYNKTFRWEYEGPVNGIGTFCDVCAEDDEDAILIIKSSYLK